MEHDPMSDDGKGIDPDLIPYLMAANEDDEPAADDTEAAPESDRLTALRALVETSLLAGPDPQLLAELMGEIAADQEEDEESIEDREDREIAELQARDKLRALSEDLFARAPEHNFAPSLDRVQALVDILGDPQDAYPSIHLAGTNGKTSTSRIIDALLGAFDLRVGRFTSPHLRDVRERITLEGEPLTPEQFLAAWEDIAPYVGMIDDQSAEKGEPRLSFFELLTVMAYAAFADYPVDVAVIETGMGGVWDATNVVNSGIAVITPISLDHQKWLGNTIEEIATEKAGIIKDRTIAVVMKQEPAVEAILQKRCEETDSVFWLEGRDWEVQSRQPGVGGQMVTVRTPAGTYEDMFVPLHGEHQAHNAAAAMVAVEAMMGGKTMNPDMVDAGLQAVRSPGRFEVLRKSPTIVVDAAHNPGGAVVLRESLEEVFHFEFIVGVFSAMADKNVEAVLVEMEPVVDELVLTELAGERAMPLDELIAIATDVFGEDRVHPHADLTEALDQAAFLTDSTVDPEAAKGIIVFGSVVLAGDATALLKPDQRIG